MSRRQSRRDAVEGRKELTREQSEESIAQNQIGSNSPMQNGMVQKEFLESLTNTSLDDGTLDILQNMLSQDFVLGYVDGAEKDELKWLARVMKLKVFAMHPGPQSVLQGDRRAFLLDDPDEKLESLAQRERLAIDQVIMGFFMRVSRSQEGFQQEQFSKTYNVSEVRRDEDDDAGRLGGLFS